MTALKSSSRQEIDHNPIREYWEQIESGKIVVCQKIYKAYRKYNRDLDRTDWEWYYDPKRANHVIGFIEKYCCHSKGKLAGTRVVLEPWEKALLAVVFGFVDIEGNRKYRESILIVGKKNGKSLIASCVGLYLQAGDGEGGPEVYAVATKLDQAKIIWLESKRMVRKSPALRKRIRWLVKELVSDFNDGIYKPVSSDSDTLDGLNIHGVLMDEIHQWKGGRALYNIMADGVAAREQPLVFITSTAGTVREDIYDEKYDEAERVINGWEDPDGYHDDRLALFIYELDNRAEWVDENCWIKANPGLGTIKNKNTLFEKVKRAKANPSLVKNLVCKEFNIRETSVETWMSFEEIDNRETHEVKELKPRYGIGGCDLSSTTDLTAASVLYKIRGDDTIYVEMMFWLPEDLLSKRVHEDQIPYDKWRERELLRTCSGNKIDYRDVVAWFKEIRDTHDIYLPWIGYDSWSASYFVNDMAEEFGKECMEAVIQGKKTLSEPTHSLGADLRAKKINYNNNPILKWNMTNVAVDIDKNNNIQPIKAGGARKRIDGFMAMLDAYVVLGRHAAEYESMI